MKLLHLSKKLKKKLRKNFFSQNLGKTVIIQYFGYVVTIIIQKMPKNSDKRLIYALPKFIINYTY